MRCCGGRCNPWLGLQVELPRLGNPSVAGCCALCFFVLLHGGLHPAEELLRGQDAGLVLGGAEVGALHG